MRILCSLAGASVSHNVHLEDAIIEYPSWYSPERLDDPAFWSEGVRLDLARFFGHCSLHDCQWIGLTFDLRYQGEGVAAFELDTFWYQDQIPALADRAWCALLVRFDRILAVRQTRPEWSDGAPRTIGGESTSNADGYSTTVIEDVYGGRVEIDHADPVTVMFLSWEGEPLVSSLSAAS